MSIHGVSAHVKLDSFSLARGRFNNAQHNDSELKFSGEITANVGKQFFDLGIDPRAGVGSKVYFSIEFSDEACAINKENECEGDRIGFMEVYPFNYPTLVEKKSPVVFNIRVTLPNKDLADFLAIRNIELKIEPTFYLPKGVESQFVVKTADTVMFYICRIHLFPCEGNYFVYN